jgi:hypothetical protein
MVLALLFGVFNIYSNVTALSAEVCPEGDGWFKVDNLSGHTYTYTARGGQLVAEYCWKAGQYTRYVNVKPPLQIVTVEKDVKYELSHASFRLVNVSNSPTPEDTPTPQDTAIPEDTVTPKSTFTATSTLEYTATPQNTFTATPKDILTPTDKVTSTPKESTPTQEETPISRVISPTSTDIPSGGIIPKSNGGFNPLGIFVIALIISIGLAILVKIKLDK